MWPDCCPGPIPAVPAPDARGQTGSNSQSRQALWRLITWVPLCRITRRRTLPGHMGWGREEHSPVESDGHEGKGWPWASSTPGQGATRDAEPVLAQRGHWVGLLLPRCRWQRAEAPSSLLIPKGSQDSLGASPRTREQNVQPGSRDRDREAQSGLTWQNGPHQGWTGWASLQRWPQAPFWTSFPCPIPVLMGTHLASHQEPLSLGQQLTRPHLRSTLHCSVLSPRTGCASSLWPWCGQASELKC